MIRTSIKNLRIIIREVAQTASGLPASVKLYEDGNEWSQLFALIDTDKLVGTKYDDVKQALLGGIILDKTNEGWSVASVSAHHGYGPLLYRVAMEFSAPDGGLRKNVGGNTSPAAKSVWAKFDKLSTQNSNIKRRFGEDADDYYYIDDGSELNALRSRDVKLSRDQHWAVRDLIRALWTSSP